jgi:hypothetical protein
LETLPQNALVEVGKEECGYGGWEKWMTFDDLDVESTDVISGIVRLCAK